MLTVLLTLLAIISPVRSDFDISRFKNEAGIFFEQVTAVGLTKTSWNIVVHINITEYATAKSRLDEAMLALTKIKEKKPKLLESFFVQNFQTAYERVINRHEIIMSSAASNRRKRSLLPFIGGIYNNLFGLMDEDHAKVLADKISNNSQNADYMLNILKNQSSLQDITWDVIKEENKVVFNNIKRLSGSMVTLKSAVNEVIDEKAVLVTITNMLTALESFEELQKGITGTIFNSKGSFLSEVLQINKFKQQIDIIKRSIKSSLMLPIDEPIELAKIAQISTATTAVYTYPTIHDGFSITIRPSSSYLLIDERKTMFYAQNEDNFDHCQKMKNILLCHQFHPFYNIRETDNCEVQLFLKPRKIPASCEIEIKKFHNYWRQTHSSNTWIFSMYEQTAAEVKCNAKTQNIILSGSGILKMNPDCQLETAEINLWAYDVYQSELNYVFPIINLSTSIPSLTHIKLMGDIETYKIPNIPTAKYILGFPSNLDVHHLTHYGMSISTWIVIIVIVIAVICILRKTCQMSQRYLPTAIALPRLM